MPSGADSLFWKWMNNDYDPDEVVAKTKSEAWNIAEQETLSIETMEELLKVIRKDSDVDKMVKDQNSAPEHGFEFMPNRTDVLWVAIQAPSIESEEFHKRLNELLLLYKAPLRVTAVGQLAIKDTGMNRYGVTAVPPSGEEYESLRM